MNSKDIQKQIQNKIDQYFDIVDTLIGLNRYTPSDSYGQNNTFVEIPKDFIDKINRLVDSNKYSPYRPLDKTNEVIQQENNTSQISIEQISKSSGIDTITLENIPDEIKEQVKTLINSNLYSPADQLAKTNETLYVPKQIIDYVTKLIENNIYNPNNNYGDINSITAVDSTVIEENEYNNTDAYGNPVEAVIKRAEKIGSYLISSNGVVFLATQAALHLANPITSQVLNPLIYPIGGFGILPDTFDALFVKYPDTIAEEPGEGHPSVSNIFPGKYGAAEQILGPYGYPYPKSGLTQIIEAIVNIVSNSIIGGSNVSLDKTGAVDYKKTPLTVALQGVNWYGKSGILTTITEYGKNGTPVTSISPETYDGIEGLVIEVMDNPEGEIMLLKSYNRVPSFGKSVTEGPPLSIKERDKRTQKMVLKVNRDITDITPTYMIPHEEPLSPSQYNLYNKETPYVTNVYRPQKLLSDIGFGTGNGIGKSLSDVINSSNNFSNEVDTKDPKYIRSRKVNIVSKVHQTDSLISEFESENRQKWVQDLNNKLVLNEINIDEVAGSYPTQVIEPLKGKLYVPLFFQALSIGSRYCFFRAYVDSWGETYSPSWQEEAAYGRSQENVIYTSTKRSIEITFTVFAGHPKELIPMYSRLNWLVRNTYPSYNDSGYISAPPIIRFTLGDLFVGLPIYITSLTIRQADGSVWEIEPGVQVPIVLNIAMSLGVLHETMPSAGGYFYKIAKTGWGDSIGDEVGTNILYNDEALGKLRGV